MPTAKAVIDKLGLQPHPEGGWYRETWRGASGPPLRPYPGPRPPPGPPSQERGSGSSILFLLEPRSCSHWHRIDAAELWLHQAGGALSLRTETPDGVIERRLGGNILGGEHLQAVVEPGAWQAAKAFDDWSLVACVVVPAFEFARFELAPPEFDLPLERERRQNS